MSVRPPWTEEQQFAIEDMLTLAGAMFMEIAEWIETLDVEKPERLQVFTSTVHKEFQEILERLGE